MNLAHWTPYSELLFANSNNLVILRKAFAQLGRKLIIQAVPAERSLANVNTGIDDGDGPRVKDLDELVHQKYKNLIQVPVQIFEWDFVLFADEKNAHVLERISSLLDISTDCSIGIVNGWKILEKSVEGITKVVYAKSPEQLLRLLANGRICYAIWEKKSGQAIAHQNNWNFKYTQINIPRQQMYFYMNKKHQAFAVKLATEMKRLMD